DGGSYCVGIDDSNPNRPAPCCVACANASTSVNLTCAYCGDGKCDAGETQGNCCSDCGCAGGLTCESNVCYATMNWVVDDGCFGGSVDYKFFDETDNLEYNNNGVAWSIVGGQKATRALLCTPGNVICIGAHDDLDGLYWGVDVDNSADCQACCFA